MALMYIVKQIDYINAASVKVLQVGQPTNIMKQLHMTADDYNWLQTLYFVSSSILILLGNETIKTKQIALTAQSSRSAWSYLRFQVTLSSENSHLASG